MGIVVAATHLELERLVALKFLLPKVLERTDFVTRFSREARHAARLQSEHVARVLDVGALENGAPYIVMEYLEGRDLAQVLAARGALPVEEAVGSVLQAIDAVAEAHSLGTVHRDLKPANLFLAERRSGAPIVKVLDFGLSKSADLATAAQVTSVSSILGSPAYMSPEQLLSAPSADARSDVWSLGVVLYELLTAHNPFVWERMPELVAAILNKPERPIAEWCAEVPCGLAEVVHRCLAKDPARRFQTAADLAGALAPFGPPGSELAIERIARMRAPIVTGKVGVEESPSAALGLQSRRGGAKPPGVESTSGSTRPSPAVLSAAGASRNRSGGRRARHVWTVGSLAGFAAVAALGSALWHGRPPHEVARTPGDGVLEAASTNSASGPTVAHPTDTFDGVLPAPSASPPALQAPSAQALNVASTSSIPKPAPKVTIGAAPANGTAKDAGASPPVLPSVSADPLGGLRPM
jgi:serine/threonine-protein kinase